MIFRFGRWYVRCLNNHPWKTQLVTSGCLVGTGDLIAQLGIERRNASQYDYTRTARFFGFGAFYFAPILRVWFSTLNRYVHWPGAPKLSPLLRVLIDQCCFGPCFVSVFLILLRLSEGNDLGLAYARWKNDFVDIYSTGLKVWPATQLINFYFVPVQYQMLVVQSVALFWNSYLAWRTNKHVELPTTVSN